jgi:hypothetical protein
MLLGNTEKVYFRNMINLTKDQIKEIAEQLDCGNRCYINKETGDIKTTPDFDNGYADEELWADVLEELEENWDKYIQIEKMESHESFELMADFAESVDSKELRESLINALNRKHPFRNFKWVVDNSGPYRQKWFDFKSQRLIEWVKDQLEVLDFEDKNE